jgi:hypothetical protein
MKRCCQNALKDLDERKKAARATSGLMAVSSLLTWLGSSPIDVAAIEIVGMVATRGSDATSIAGRTSDLEQVARATCRKLCELHSLEHTNKGENEEGRFWREMARGF